VTERLRIGCSGWNYDAWRVPVYDGAPAATWLCRYATVFDTVEVNATFYRLPTRATTERWVEQTPARFVFAVKASRYLTHVRRLRDLGRGVERFFDPLEPLRSSGRLGPILWQLPETFQRDDERLAAALERLPRAEHAWEFRHRSWFAADVYALLREHGAALVIGDTPERPFQEHVLTAPWTYVRLHRGRRGRRGNYSDTELRDWASRLRSFAPGWVYFNNDWEAFAVRNARRLRSLLCELGSGV
jgi:uncharacterized protein YecE (DUF72 family)